LDGKTTFSSGPYDVLVLRLTDEIANAFETSQKAIVDLYEAYVLQHPDLRVIDPFKGQRMVVSRLLMADIFDKLAQRVCKATQASGSISSHLHTIAWDVKSLLSFEQSRLDEEFIIQEYVNHDATLFKVYVLRGLSFTVSRASLRNLPKPPVDGPPMTPIQFDSQKWKDSFPENLTADDGGRASPPEDSEVQGISYALTELLGLTMFGFDLIRNADTRRYSVVDVNYFPDYRGVPEFHSLLLNHFVKPL
jgi:inositol-1,3,4-trisphosphate 5/6-kinase/inositol-tetrakisphosphate 1-kinase